MPEPVVTIRQLLVLHVWADRSVTKTGVPHWQCRPDFRDNRSVIYLFFDRLFRHQQAAPTQQGSCPVSSVAGLLRYLAVFWPRHVAAHARPKPFAHIALGMKKIGT